MTDINIDLIDASLGCWAISSGGELVTAPVNIRDGWAVAEQLLPKVDGWARQRGTADADIRVRDRGGELICAISLRDGELLPLVPRPAVF